MPGLRTLLVVVSLGFAQLAGAAEPAKIGDRVQVKVGENWVDATVTDVEGARVRAKIAAGVESWFGAGDYRAAAAAGAGTPAKPEAGKPAVAPKVDAPKPQPVKPIVVGQKVFYEQARYWKPGTVTAREATRIKVKPEFGPERWFELKDVTPVLQGDAAFFAGLSEGAEILAQDNIGWLKATVLAREPERVKIHYVGWSDAWDTWLGPDKVRPLAGGAAGTGVGGGTTVAGGDGTSTTVVQPAVPSGDLAGVRELKVEEGTLTWAVKPDPMPEPGQKPAAGPLPLGVKLMGPATLDMPYEQRVQAMHFKEAVERIVFTPLPAPAATVVIVKTEGLFTVTSTQVVRMAMAGAKAPERVELPEGVRLMGVSPDGSRVVTRLKVGGLSNCVQVSTFAGSKLTPVVTWKPYKEEGTSSARPGHEDLTLAEFVDGGHVVTCDKDGSVILWKLPEQAAGGAATQAVVQPKGVYRLKVGNQVRPVLSPGRRVLAAEGFGTFRFFDVMTGAPLGGLELQAWNGSVSFKGDGTQMAVRSGPRLTLVDTASGRTLREIPLAQPFAVVGPEHWGLETEFLPGGYLLHGRRWLVSPSARMVIWDYRFPNSGPGVNIGGAVYYVAPMRDGTGMAGLYSTKLPHEGAAKAVAEAGGRIEDLLIFKPGSSVQLDIATDAPADVRQKIQASFERQLKAIGVNVGGGGNTRVRVSSENGETKPITYRIFGRGSETVSVPEKTHKVVVEVDGKEAWTWQSKWAPSMMVSARQGQTLTDAVRADAERSYGVLATVQIPGDAVRGDLYKVAGASAVTANGVEALKEGVRGR